MPDVAVIIPAYNAARTLEATLESLFAQTMENFEAALVDDGSTDSTFDIASAFAGREARLKVIRQPNGGLADARNAGIRHTQAPLIAALDADDVWHPTFLEKLSSAMNRGGKETALAYANSRIIDLDGFVLNNAPSYDESGCAFNRLLLLNFIGNGSAMMFRRELAIQVGAYERRLQYEFKAQGSEDWLLALRLAAHGKVASVQEYLVGYRSTPGAMSENTLRMRHSRLYALKILYSEIECQHTKPARWALGTAHAKCFLHEMLSLQVVRALGSLFAALRFDPVGTCALLFGRERRMWFKDEFLGRDTNSPRRPFADFNPGEGRMDQAVTGVERARQWE